jgi:hypothetical protein
VLLSPGTKFEFGEALEKGRQEAEIVATERDLPAQPVYLLEERKLELAHKYPEAAIMEAYKEVEQVLLRVRDRLDLHSRANLRTVVRRLVELQLIDSEVEPFFISFRNARNAAVHPVAENAVSPAGALEYLGQARLLTSIFTDALARLTRADGRAPQVADS